MNRTSTHILTLFACIILGLSQVNAQTYADSQSSGTSGLCIGCSVSNASNSVDGNNGTYTTLNATAGALGASVWTNVNFPIGASAGSTANIIVEDPGGGLLNASLLGALQITAKSGTSSVASIASSGLSITLLPGSTTKYTISFTPCCAFDNLRITLNAGLLSVLSSLRIYSAYYTAAPLPVELLSYQANLRGGIAEIHWSTATEHNNNFFTIERSNDGVKFEELATINGAGNSSTKQTYSYKDRSPLPGINYYRLAQTDFDGSLKYMGIQSLEIEGALSASISVLRNDKGKLNLKIMGLSKDQELEINVYSILGTQISTFKTVATENTLDYLAEKEFDNNVVFVIVSSNSKVIAQQKVVLN